MSRPQAAPSSNGWKGANCPALQHLPQEVPDESLGCDEPKHPFGRPRRDDRRGHSTDARQSDQRSAGDRRGQAGRNFDRGRPLASQRDRNRAAPAALARDPDGAGTAGRRICPHPWAQGRGDYDPRPRQRHPRHAARRDRRVDGTPPRQAGAGARR